MKLSLRLLGTVILLSTSYSTVSCAEQQSSWQTLRDNPAVQPSAASNPQELQLLANEFLQVIDDHSQPVANATILLGYELGNPFNGNLVKTNAAGKAGIPANWKAALPITVQAPGFVTTTLPMVQPGSHRVQLSRQEGAQEFEVQGTTSGYGRLIQDGKVDFGLVIPAISREQMLAFDVSAMISPKIDTIEIVGNRVNLPSNIALPQQTETYVFPIQLNKPDYRVYVRQPGNYKLTAIHGQFPLQRVVNDIRAGKSIFEVINHFNFTEGGQTDVTVNGNLSALNMDVNQSRFDSSVAVRAPNLGANQIMLSVSLMEQNGLFMPTDLKRLTSGQSMNLKSKGTNRSVLSLLLEDNTELVNNTESLRGLLGPLFDMAELLPKNTLPVVLKGPQDFSRLSFAFQAASASGVQPNFLPLVAKPVLSGNIINMQVPQLLPGLTPVATYLVFSEVEVLGEGNTKSERRTRMWEIWSQAWLNQVELPKIEFVKNPGRKYRWEILFLARPSHFIPNASGNGQVDLTTVTHITRNALDI